MGNLLLIIDLIRILIVSRHVQALFLCCFKSAMATYQNIKNKTLRRLTQLTVGPWQIDKSHLGGVFSCNFAFIFKLKPLLGNLFVVDKIWRPEDIQYCHSWKLKAIGTLFVFLDLVIHNFSAIFWKSFLLISDNVFWHHFIICSVLF